MYVTYQIRLCCLFLLLSTGLLYCIKLASSREDELFYITPTQPPNPECPKDHSCQTLQYHLENIGDISYSNKGVTLMFISGNHTVAPCHCTRRYFSANISMIGLGGNIVIYDLEARFFVALLIIENLIFQNGVMSMDSANGIDHKFIQLHFDSVKLTEGSLFIDKTEIGEILKLEAHNSLVSIIRSNNLTFTNCTFHDFDGVPYPSQILRTPIETAVTVRQSHITFCGNSKFNNNHNSALISHLSVITMAGSVSFFNNSGIRGGAMILYSSTLNLVSSANISFINNSAQETGGAIHVEPDITRIPELKCFYQIEHCTRSNTVTLYFTNNSAKVGGDNVYGTSLAYCQYLLRRQDCHIDTILLDTRESSVSSDPIYVCVCDNEGRPQCTNTSFINMSMNVYPSEKFTLSVAIVGADYGMTVGNVHANLLIPDTYTSRRALPAPIFEHGYQYSQWIDDASCTELKYSIYTEYNVQQSIIMYLTVQYTKNPGHLAVRNHWKYCNSFHLLNSKCRNSPIYINVTVLPCPLGFLKSPSRCDCYPPLIEKGVQCVIMNGTGYFIWNDAFWISVNEGGIVYTENCPLKHCTITNKMIDLIANPNAQCAFNRAGRLCGSCRKGYSLAIGSSHCIPCSDNNNIALLIFFINCRSSSRFLY